MSILMRKRWPGYAALLVLLLGLWQVGGGLYIHAKALLAQQLLLRAWESSLAGKQQAKPWPWADTWPVARLFVPAHGVDQIVLTGATGRTLAFAPGHIDGSAMPGAAGSVVLSGHRDTHFSFLAGLKSGDGLELQSVDGVMHRYQVLFSQVIDADHLWMPTGEGDALLMLVTCYPFDAVNPGATQRYQVVATESTENTEKRLAANVRE